MAGFTFPMKQLPNNPKLPPSKRDTDQDMDSDATDPVGKKKGKLPPGLQAAAAARLAASKKK